jgi:hypothetical protein
MARPLPDASPVKPSGVVIAGAVALASALSAAAVKAQTPEAVAALARCRNEGWHEAPRYYAVEVAKRPSADGYTELGGLYKEVPVEESFDKAADAYRSAVRLDPDHTGAWLARSGGSC